MRIKLDENLPVRLKPHLQFLEHDVSTAADEGLLRRPDHEVWSVARSDGRMLFTMDLDFADPNRYAPGGHPGIVLFRPRARGPGAADRFVLRFAEAVDLDRLVGCHVTVHPGRVRIRRPPAST